MMLPVAAGIGALSLAAAAALLWGEAPWWALGLVGLPALLWAPGYGFACRLEGNAPSSGVQRGIDAAWIGMALAWLDVAVVREVGLRGEEARWALLGMAALWMLLGWAAGWGRMHPRSTPRREWLGVAAVVGALLLLLAWRSADLSRPLDGHWYLRGADVEGHQPLPLRLGMGWQESEPIGWAEAGAMRLVPAATQPHHTLIAADRLRGRLIAAVRGPLGTEIAIQGVRNTIAQEMTEDPEEGPVRRYLSGGVAAVAVHIELEPGAEVALEITGAPPAETTIYIFPSTDAVWAAHAVGELRYVHYYQLLNQVENQVWAEEILDSRRFTWNQPPGWSPLLAYTVLFLEPDLPGANALFLWVLLLVGAAAVRLLSLLAPGAPSSALLLPAGMVLSHGLLMIEPGSTNFPDSLYAASLVTVAITLATGRATWLALAGMAAGVLRWPGIITTTLFALWWWQMRGENPTAGLLRLWLLVALAALAALLAISTGDAEDLAFVLWFETFPEHWHDNYSPLELLSRIPAFYGRWLMYTGGGLLLAAVGLWGAPSPERRGLRFLMAATLTYSGFLCTVDHNPTHYFLPLVALTGPMVGVAAATLRRPAARHGLVALCGLGLLILLWRGQVL